MNEYKPLSLSSLNLSSSATASTSITTYLSPFLFHYIILFIIVLFIVCVCVLKFKYLYWYSQPLTFRFTFRRFGGGGEGKYRTNVMNSLSLADRCYNAVVYSFLHHVNHTSVRVYRGTDEDTPFDKIAGLLERADSEIVIPGPGRREMTLRLILSQDTFGLSAFIGVMYDVRYYTSDTIRIKGVSIITPRIMISFGSSSTAVAHRSVSIYMCEYLVWGKYTVSERETLELLETTEYIQKAREIAGEQTLYRYREIPWFVIPFTTVYSYTFSTEETELRKGSKGAPLKSGLPSLTNGTTVVPVSSVNFALFYSFINECTRDFRCIILNELTQLQSLVSHGLYRIYMMLVNNVRVVAVYIFTPSMIHTDLLTSLASRSSSTTSTSSKINKKKTKGNRIDDIHDYVSKTSTALVKYLPPVISPKYDAFGKRVKPTDTTSVSEKTSRKSNEDVVLRLISSIQHKTLCDNNDFIKGFQFATTHLTSLSRSRNCVMIDTLAHNYRLIDGLLATNTPVVHSWKLSSQDKWYYILYNAIIHQETLCKDILIV
jgi:hypothetical protein